MSQIDIVSWSLDSGKCLDMTLTSWSLDLGRCHSQMSRHPCQGQRPRRSASHRLRDRHGELGLEGEGAGASAARPAAVGRPAVSVALAPKTGAPRSCEIASSAFRQEIIGIYRSQQVKCSGGQGLSAHISGTLPIVVCVE